MGLRENIKAKRTELDLTLEQVAQHVGVGRQTIQKYESGIVANIPSDRIEKLAEILQTTPGALMGWVESTAQGSADLSLSPAAIADDGLSRKRHMIEERLRKMDEAGLDFVIAATNVLFDQQSK